MGWCILASIVFAVAAYNLVPHLDDRNRKQNSIATGKDETQKDGIHRKSMATRVAFVGNSIQYFNDLPRVLVALNPDVEQDSCLCGGARFASLIKKGNCMQKKWATPQAQGPDGSYDIGAPTVASLLLGNGVERKAAWDYAVMNDYTQGPARAQVRAQSLKALVQDYAPLLRASGGIPVLIATHAYRAPRKGSHDLGDHVAFTEAIEAGIQDYAHALGAELPEAQFPKIARVGAAFEKVRTENPELWELLFQPDDRHPSPHGTYLQGCVVHCAIFNKPPAASPDPPALFKQSRRMQPPQQAPCPMPTQAEAEYLRSVAVRVSLETFNSKWSHL